MKRKLLRVAEEACQQLEARQVVLVVFFESERFAVVSYGDTKRECAAVRPLCDAIADAIATGALPNPRSE